MRWKIFKSKTLWTWFVLLLFVFSTLGFVMQRSSNETRKSFEYNGLKLFQQDGKWVLVLDNRVYFFRYFPAELENMTGDFSLNLSQKMYFVYNSSDDVDFSGEMTRLGSLLAKKGVRLVKACVSEEYCPEDLPIRPCNNETVPRIFFKLGNTTQAYDDQNCKVLEANSTFEMDKAIDRVYYQLIGVMK